MARTIVMRGDHIDAQNNRSAWREFNVGSGAVMPPFRKMRHRIAHTLFQQTSRPGPDAPSQLLVHGPLIRRWQI
jgi:hypothetical protein